MWSGHATDGTLLWDGAIYHADTRCTGWVFTPARKGRTFALPGGDRDGYGDCGGEPVPTSIRLRADRSDADLLWLQGGDTRYGALWPDGYTVTFGARAVVKDPEGTVVAREGDRLGTSIGTTARTTASSTSEVTRWGVAARASRQATMGVLVGAAGRPIRHPTPRSHAREAASLRRFAAAAAPTTTVVAA